MRDVAVIAWGQTKHVLHYPGNEIELLGPLVSNVVRRSGLDRAEIDVTTASSNDFFAGQAFAFVRALDAIGAYPVIDDSHLDMDGAWALYEAWVRLQTGEADTALVYALGRTSACNIHEVTPLQYDPYTLQLLGIDPHSMAALHARCLLDSGRVSAHDMAETVLRSRADAVANPRLWHDAKLSAEEYAAQAMRASPLRESDCPPRSDAAAAVVLATADRARALCERPVWIRGLDHRIDSHYPGARDLTRCKSAQLAAHHSGVAGDRLDLAELSACYSHEERLLALDMGLGSDVRLNPSGGALNANPVMATGLVRIVEVVDRIGRGRADRGLAHAASGPCLQQNLVCVLEGD